MRVLERGTVCAIVLMTMLAGVANKVSAPPAQDTLIVGVQNDTPNLHPWDITTNSVWKDFMWRRWVFEGLFGRSPDGSLYPLLATSYDYSPSDPLNATVHIRPGVTFTDGVSMDADDVVFTFQVLAFNSQLSDSVLGSIVWPDPPTWTRWNASTSSWGAANPSHVGIEKIDTYTVKFHMRQPYPLFFQVTLTNPIMPAHIWKDHLVCVDLSSGWFVLPDGAPISQGTEFDFDRDFGSQPTETQATIGTGPWQLAQWTPLTSLNLSTYANYWGKSYNVTWQGRDWPRFPTSISHMDFRVYGSFDAAIRGLKYGEVHLLPWNVPLNYYDELKLDSRLGFKSSPADGYYYMAFNMRKEPMNDLSFRRAISAAVDKDFIIGIVLNGHGTKAHVPVSVINPTYVNSSAITPSFDLGFARSALDAAGYMDINADGWRDYPDGRPLKLSILTPAMDYDPVRAKSGIMISANLNSIGLKVESYQTVFDSIVSSVFVEVRFDMYILGWLSLGPFPELYLEDFFGCGSDVVLGLGDNTAGFCNLEFEQKLSIMKAEMDDARRVQAVKDAQGILAGELPYNPLYILRWIEGYRADLWAGWASVEGSIFNSFSIGILAPPPAPSPPAGLLTVDLSIPSQGIAGTTSHFQVRATQGALPVAGADVLVTATTGEWSSNVTDASGYTDIQFTLPSVSGDISFIASAVKGADVGGDLAQMLLFLPNDLAQLTMNTSTPVVGAGGSAVIAAKVTDRDGAPLVGVPVQIARELLSGDVTPMLENTDSSGVAYFTYSAPPPSLIQNRNHYDLVIASAIVPTKMQVPETKRQTLAMGVENPFFDWYILSVQSVSALVVDNNPGTAIPLDSTVTVRVTNEDGNPVVNEDVIVSSSNQTALLVDQAVKKTDVSGSVSFIFTANTTFSTSVAVNFTTRRAYQSMSGLNTLVTDGVTRAFASFMTLGPRFVNPNSPVSITVTVYNETGAPSIGSEVDIFVPYADVGNPIEITSPGWTFNYPAGTTFTGFTDGSGVVTTSFSTKSFSSDHNIVLETGIAGFGPRGAFILGNPTSSYSYGSLVAKRNKVAAVASWVMSPVVLTSQNSTANLTVSLGDLSGPATGTGVSVYRGTGDLRPGKGATKIGDFITDSNGQVKVQWTEPSGFIDTPLGFTAAVTSPDYALGHQYGSMPFERYFAYLLENRTELVAGPPITSLVVGDPKYVVATTYITSWTPLELFAADQSGAGIECTEFRVDGGGWTSYLSRFTLAGEGPHLIEWFSRDNKGGVENVKSQSVTVDNTAPTTTVSPDGPYGPSTMIVLAAIDQASGVNRTDLRVDGGPWLTYSVPFNLSAGTHNIEYGSIDNLGNTEEPRSTQIVVDGVPPTTTLLLGDPRYLVGGVFVNSSTPVFLLAVDTGSDPSGVNVTSYRTWNGTWSQWHVYQISFRLTGEDGVTYVEYYSTDLADNQGTTENATLILDNTPPETSVRLGEPKYETTDTYIRSATEVNLTVSDEGATPAGLDAIIFRIWNGTWSSWRNYSAPFTLDGRDGTRYVEYFSKDVLGNAEIVRNLTVVLDNSPPTTTFLPEADEFPPETVLTLNASDSGSGVNVTQYRVDGGEWINYTGGFTLTEGLHNITYRSIDRLGNTELEKSRNVQIIRRLPPGVFDYVWPLALVILVVVLASMLAALFWRRRKKTGERREPPIEPVEHPEKPEFE